MLARASLFNLPHTRSTLSLVTNQHHSRTLTYGSCALRRWPSPQHGMKGTRAGRNGWPSHRLPCQAAASIQPRSMAVLRAHTCSDHQDAVMEVILDGGVSRALMFSHQRLLLSTRPPPARQIPFGPETYRTHKVTV